MSKLTSYFSSYSGTRPNDTTAYSNGDVYGDNSKTLGTQIKFDNLGKADSSVMLTSGCLSLQTDLIPSERPFSGFRLYLYNVARPVGIPDNLQWFLFDSGQGIDERNKYRGYIDFIPYISLSNAYLYFQNNNINKQIKLSSSALYGHLVTLGTYSNPGASTQFTIELNTVQL